MSAARRRAPALAAWFAVATIAAAASEGGITAFSIGAPGTALPAPWKVQRLSRIPPAEVSLVKDGAQTVLQVRSIGASGTAIHPLSMQPHEEARLRWRWKIDRTLAGADMTRREGDDFAARVYVFFDVPRQSLDLATRVKIRLAHLLYGVDIPAAALCYVWDNRQKPGYSAWNPYSDRVRMIVLRSGDATANAWQDESRDVAKDFQVAFGGEGAVPRIAGIAAGNDTDQTGESATAWFADFRLEGR